MLEILAAIVIVYLHDQADRIENDDDDRPSIRHVSKRARFLMSVNVPRRFLALRGLFEEVGASPVGPTPALSRSHDRGK